MNEALFRMAKAIETPLYEETIRLAERYRLVSGERIVLDLKDYRVGHFSFRLARDTVYLDAPVRFRIRFCECEREIDEDFSVCNGSICSSWLEEEVVTVDREGEVRLARRYACRYITVTVLAAPRPIRLSDFCFVATTSADVTRLPAWPCGDAELARIDRISCNTLKNCMQSFFEDGPKRDRRLWIGDLRLQALANYVTFRNNGLVRKCLLYFAAGDPITGGFVSPAVFLEEGVESDDWLLIDYALLYTVALCDYYEYTKDAETARLLFDFARRQIDLARPELDFAKDNQRRCHIDWCPGLRKNISLYGIYLYTLDRFAGLCEALNRAETARSLRAELAEARKECLARFYDPACGLFRSPLDGGQASLHSQIWMILAGVGDRELWRCLLRALQSTPYEKEPLTPYMYHYVAEAFCAAGMEAEAIDYIRQKWGEIGDVDTYPEVFSPGNPDFSPYNERKLNSMCHAWSCTPTYFFRVRNGGLLC